MFVLHQATIVSMKHRLEAELNRYKKNKTYMLNKLDGSIPCS
jgi:hypothetical protein